MNYNKYIINKKKKQAYILLIVPLIIFGIAYFIINSVFNKNTIPFKIIEVIQDINKTNIYHENNSEGSDVKNEDLLKEESISKEEDLSKQESVAANSNAIKGLSYFLIGFYEADLNASSEKLISSLPFIKISYNGEVFFLMKIMVKDEVESNKKLIEDNGYSAIQIDLSNSKTNDKLMNSIFLSMKEIFSKLCEEDIKAIKTLDFKNWILALPKEKENEKYYENLVNIRQKVKDLKEDMILEDCIDIIQLIIN